MSLALDQAKLAFADNEVPVGAVLVHGDSGRYFSDYNHMKQLKNPLAHAEINVIQQGILKSGQTYLTDWDLFVTLEPCALCAAAIALVRLRRVVFAASDPKGGGVIHGVRYFNQPTCHHRPEIIDGPMAESSSELLQRFFKERRG